MLFVIHENIITNDRSCGRIFKFTATFYHVTFVVKLLAFFRKIGFRTCQNNIYLIYAHLNIINILNLGY